MKWLKEKLLVLAVIVVLFQLGNYVDTAATGITIEKTIEKPITDQQELVRRPRFARPIFAIFHTLGNIKRIFQDVSISIRIVFESSFTYYDFNYF